MLKLPTSFYLSDNVESIATSLLGKYLLTNIGGVVTGGMITETEAYKGITDKASHAFGGKRTTRTEIMYRQGGIAYIYLCYGVHYLLNVVTADVDIPHAVLIRGIYPLVGISSMLARTGKSKADYRLSDGPGKLTKALGIDITLNGISYNTSNSLWIEDRGVVIVDRDIIRGPRVGVDYAAEDAFLPYRYILVYKNYIT